MHAKLIFSKPTIYYDYILVVPPCKSTSFFDNFHSYYQCNPTAGAGIAFDAAQRQQKRRPQKAK
jgi:hypothetical protein